MTGCIACLVFWFIENQLVVEGWQSTPVTCKHSESSLHEIRCFFHNTLETRQPVNTKVGTIHFGSILKKPAKQSVLSCALAYFVGQVVFWGFKLCIFSLAVNFSLSSALKLK